MDLIRVEQLTKEYVNEGVATPVLHGLSFGVPKGQFLAIMGPSGSGKSTLMQILGFLDVPTSGRYFFEDRDVSTQSDDEYARLRGEKIGFIFQAFHLLPKTSVFDNVMLPLLYSSLSVSEREERVQSAIEAVSLSHRVQNLSNQLSGGERQRVAIARALVRQPSIIFADEPTGNLDSVSGKAVMDMLRDLNKLHGHTIILVTHDHQVAEYAQRVLTMKDGQIVGDVEKGSREVEK